MNVKFYEDLAEKRSVFYPDIERALEIVRAFIIRKKRILYGGMAVDLSLKKAGHEGIYKADAIPDYDFMSPDFYEDSNQLALELHQAGLPNVSAIHAIHYTSRRVRVNFITVADITYIPLNIYEEIPSHVVNQLRVVHPNFQRLDMHRALSTPYEKPPGEVILQRAKKDITRFKLLAEYYPLPAGKLGKKKSLSCSLASIGKDFPGGVVVGGIVAYAFYYQKYLEVVKELKEEPLAPAATVDVSDTEIVVEGCWDRFTIITDYMEEVGARLGEGKRYNKYLDDLRPLSILIGQREVYSNLDRLLPIYPSGIKDVWLACPQYILLYFLLAYQERDEGLAYYHGMVEMIKAAEKLFLSSGKESPFFFPAEVYGKSNRSPEYLIFLEEKTAKIEGREVDKSFIRPPFGFYPEKGSEWPAFDFHTRLYAIDGQPC